MNVKKDDLKSPSDYLSALLLKVETKGFTVLTTEELINFGRSYRRVVSKLSKARSAGLTDSNIEFLNKLAGRAYAYLYTKPAEKKISFRTFITKTFPVSFRKEFNFILLSTMIFLFSALFCYFYSFHNAEMPDLLLGPGWTDDANRLAERHAGFKNWLPEENRPIASSQIMTNNIKVSFLAFSAGIFFGLGTLYVLCYNGMMLGTIGSVVQQYGTALNFWGFVLPHGVIELLAIFISGGAGLKIGYALIDPGKYRRNDSLKKAAKECLPLIGGIVCMLVVAGIIEAFVSHMTEIPSEWKIFIAIVEAVFLFFYFKYSGKNAY